ncbi:MAG: Ger(x)C family spore germination protein [Bacillota bacterium]
MRRVLAMVLLVLTVFAGGCWDLREVEDLAFVLAIAVDTTPRGEFKLLVQVINPRALVAGPRGGLTPGASIPAKPYRNYEAVGRTIFYAFRELSLGVPKRLFLAQNREILFTEKVARQGLGEIIDLFDRGVEIRKLAHVLLIKGEMEEVLELPGALTPAPALRIEGIIRQQHLANRYPLVNLGNFLRLMETEGQEAYCPVIRLEKSPTQVLRPHEPTPLAPEPAFQMIIAGTALFCKDKLRGFFNEREARGLLWAKGEVQGGALVVPCPSGKGKISLEILRSEARMIPEITNDGRLKVTVKIREEANLAETTSPIDTSKAEVIKQLEGIQAKAIEREVVSAVHRAQEYGSDVFGFGAAFHRRYPREWQAMRDAWAEEFFPMVEVKVAAEAKIRRTQMRTKPLLLERKFRS